MTVTQQAQHGGLPVFKLYLDVLEVAFSERL